MKFGKRLRDEMCPEWRLSYMDYKLLKKLIKRIQNKLEERYHIDMQMILNEVPPSEIGVPSDYLDKPLISFSDEMVYAVTGLGEEKDERNFINYLEEYNLEGMYLKIVPKETCQFFNRLEKELDKVNKFYIQTERKFCVRHAELLMQLSVGLTETLSKNDKQKVRSAFQEHYRALLLLMNFRTLNFQGFSNILKKLDKYTKSKTKSKLMKRVRDSYFTSSKVLDYMMSQIEYKCSVYMFKGDRKKAKDFLRLPQTVEKQTSPFRSGISVGIGIVLSVAFVLTYVFLYPRDDPPSFSDATMYVYRLTLVPIILAVLVGVNLQIWKNARINYVFIFRFDPRDHLSVSQYIEMTMSLYNITMGSLIIYMYSIITNTFYEYAYLHPIFLFTFIFIYMCFPYKWFYGHSRLWLFRIILRLLMAPFRKVEFADFWFADQLTSLSDFLFEIQFVYCVYPSLWVDKIDSFCSDSRSLGIPVLNILPNYIRLMQCLRRYRDSKKPHPHITNAFKYLSSIIATLIAFLDKNIVAPTLPGSSWNYMRTTWVVVNIISSTYKLLWDVVMDWSLMQFNKDAEHKLLRKELFFHPYFYYFSIVTNILARFFWIVVLLLKQFYSKYLTDQWIGFCFGLVEILRRFQWNCIRLENEHLNNVGEFRATNEIPLPFEITRMINAKEKEITNVDKFLHYIFFFCSPKPDDENDNNHRRISLNPKNFLKHSISHVSSLLGHGFDSTHHVKPRKVVQQEHEYELNMHRDSLGSLRNTNGIETSTVSNGVSNKDVVIDIKDDEDAYDEDKDSDQEEEQQKVELTKPASQSNDGLFVNTSNLNARKQSLSSIKVDTSSSSMQKMTRTIPPAVEMSPSMKSNSASKSKKTIVVVEDDEIPETPHLTTRFGDIFTAGEPESQQLDNEKSKNSGDQEKK